MNCTLIMKRVYLLALFCVVFSSCKKEESVPDAVAQFSEEALEASINVYPSDTYSFYENYFNERVNEEYLDRLYKNAIIWRGTEHEVTLQEADLISSIAGVAEYRFNYWVTFNDKREFLYTMHVLNENGTMSLTRFEPMTADVASTFYAPNSTFATPNVFTNKLIVQLTYGLMLISFISIVFLAFKKKNYLLLLSLPLLFIYKMGMTTYHFEGVTVDSLDLYYGIPLLFNTTDLRFLSIDLLPIGVFFAWASIILYFVVSSFKTKKYALANL